WRSWRRSPSSWRGCRPGPSGRVSARPEPRRIRGSGAPVCREAVVGGRPPCRPPTAVPGSGRREGEAVAARIGHDERILIRLDPKRAETDQAGPLVVDVVGDKVQPLLLRAVRAVLVADVPGELRPARRVLDRRLEALLPDQRPGQRLAPEPSGP